MSELPRGGWEIPEMQFSWQRVAVIGIAVAGAVSALALGGPEMATSILTLIGL